ncbi:SipW-dependent-type signal peptide-containing protein [Paenarthrobacter sp. NPDC091711]|uniref:SipW-dependent-type signal peptide-containing protein n=1 Tax=Paenarthrobacter sp. NPDC091711 TaxID=3364385 RepID=UPI0037FFD0AD
MVAKTSSNKATKVRALLAGGLVLGVGAAFTLAAWTDNEWIFGNSGGDNGPGTLTYHMEQNTFTNTNGGGADLWSDKPNIPTAPDSSAGGDNDGALTFGAISAALKPGDTAYAPMQLRAAAGSEALTATLAEALKLGGTAPASDTTDNSLALYNALTVRAVSGVTKQNCADGVLTGGTDIVGSAGASVPLTTTSGVAISLPKGADAATAGAAVDVCFAITLPSSVTDVALQGKQTIPLWRFTSIAGS